MFSNTKVLVTGGSGVIGKELIKLLLEEGAHVRNVDITNINPHPVKDSSWLNIKPYNEYEFWQCDLSNHQCQPFFRFRPQYVFHLAADFDRAEENKGFWYSHFNNNVMASRVLLDKIIEVGSVQKIIFASSYLVYNPWIYNDTVYTNFLSEDTPLNPRNLCGMAKLQTEKDLQFIQQHFGIEHVSARIFRVYGKGSHDIISRWIRSAIRANDSRSVNSQIKVYRPENAFDYIYASDVAAGLMSLAKSRKSVVYNIGCGNSIRIKDIVSLMMSYHKTHGLKEIKQIETTQKDSWAENSAADIRKIMKDTDWVPQVSIEKGIRDIYNHELFFR